MAVKPMAGTARMVPATRPFTTSCRICGSRGRSRASGDLQQLELAFLGLLVAELRVEDVPRLGEVAGPARALVVDLLVLGKELEPIDRAVHLRPRPLGDLADVVLDGGAGRLAGAGDGETHEARVVVALRGVRIHLLHAEGLGQALVSRGVDGRRRRDD